MHKKTLFNKNYANLSFNQIKFESKTLKIFSYFSPKFYFSQSNLSISNREKTFNKEYKSLTIFQPDHEILKFYKNYLSPEGNPSKEEYNKMYNSKLEYINQRVSVADNSGMGFINYSATLQKLTKFSGILEYKHEMQDILKIIAEKITFSEEKYLKELSEYYFKS
jgi:hypothetical protein